MTRRERGGEPQAIGQLVEAPAVALGDVSAATMEALVVGGDLSKLTPAQRLEVYQARCHAAGLDPRTQPFSYLQLSGKLTLYATKTATDQLVATRRLSVQVADRKHLPDVGLYEVLARVTFPDGRMVEDVGVVTTTGLRGDAAANAIMKAITKAKRRAILSACGLGMLDETEVGTIPDARVHLPEAQHVAPVAVPVVEVVQEAMHPDRTAAMQKIAEAWRLLGWQPDACKADIKKLFGADRLRDLEIAELHTYADVLADELANAEAVPF